MQPHGPTDWLQRFKEEAVLRQRYALVATDRDKRLFCYQPQGFVSRHLQDLHQVQLNYPFRVNGFAFDIDNPEDFEALDRLPTFQTFNASNAKSHLVYMLERPFENRSKRLALDIGRLYLQAKIFTRSDLEYRNITTKNPFNPAYRVRVIGGSVQNIFQDFHQVQEVEIPQRPLTLFNFHYYSQAPNILTFRETAKAWSKANTRLYFTERDTYVQALYQEIERFNAIVREDYRLTPLPDNTAEAAALSVLEFLDNAAPVLQERFSRRQAAKAKIAAATTAEKKRALMEEKIIRAFEELAEEGSRITLAAIARRSGVSRQNIHQNYKPLVAELQQRLKKPKKIITR